MNETRKILETAILEKYFQKKYLFTKEGTKDVLLLGVKSQTGKVYQLSIELPEDYPFGLPKVFVVYPKALKSFNGSSIKKFSHEMHTLDCSNNKIGICHFHPNFWSPSQSLYKVAIKCKLWLESYEGHLNTGKPISDYLKT